MHFSVIKQHCSNVWIITANFSGVQWFSDFYSNNAHKIFFFMFYVSFTAHQDYFTHFEPSQSLGGAKMGHP